MHARKAVLGGLSAARESGSAAAASFDVVQRLRSRIFRDLSIGVNGGLRTVCQSRQALAWADGIMLGREAYHRPYLLTQLHRELIGDELALSPDPMQLLEAHGGLRAERQVVTGERLSSITRHMLGLCTGQPRGATIPVSDTCRRVRAKRFEPGPQHESAAESAAQAGSPVEMACALHA